MSCHTARRLTGARAHLRSLAKTCDGTAAVELAIVLPPFLLLLFGIIEAGLMFWTQSSLQYAVEAAARCAVVDTTTCGSTSAIQTYAASKVAGLVIPSSSFNVTTPSCGHQVSISYPFNFVDKALFSGAITLNAKSCHP